VAKKEIRKEAVLNRGWLAGWTHEEFAAIQEQVIAKTLFPEFG
jgi:hypothetical protein